VRVARWVAGLLVVVAALWGGWRWFCATLHVSLIYRVEARFTSLPADDRGLCRWLKAQPGVVPHSVSVCRQGPDGKLVVASFIQSRTLSREPPFPDLDGGCAALGYAADGPGFTDSPTRDGPLCPCE
jgi:hypothetical protein